LIVKEGGGPRTPRLRRVIDGQAASETRVEGPGAIAGGGAGHRLDEEVAIERGVPGDAAAAAVAGVRKDAAACGEVACPAGLGGGVESGQELPGAAVAQACGRRAG